MIFVTCTSVLNYKLFAAQVLLDMNDTERTLLVRQRFEFRLTYVQYRFFHIYNLPLLKIQSLQIPVLSSWTASPNPF
jgi:hypothetical protein